MHGPTCACGLPATRRQVSKPGKTRPIGTVFYNCPNSLRNPLTKCEFFMWHDEWEEEQRAQAVREHQLAQAMARKAAVAPATPPPADKLPMPGVAAVPASPAPAQRAESAVPADVEAAVHELAAVLKELSLVTTRLAAVLEKCA